MSSRTKFILAAAIVLVLAYLAFAADLPYGRTPSGLDAVVPAFSTSTDAAATTTDMAFTISPRPGDSIASPVTITGYARGPWYFEATFPIDVVASDGTVLGTGQAKAEGEWTTFDYVPWKATISFSHGSSTAGSIRLKRDNPSGDPARDLSIDVPVTFATSTRSR